MEPKRDGAELVVVHDAKLTFRPLPGAEGYAYIGDLCPTAQSMALDYVERLRIGKARFGAWPSEDDRDWAKEAQEELMDAQIYIQRAMEMRGRK